MLTIPCWHKLAQTTAGYEQAKENALSSASSRSLRLALPLLEPNQRTDVSVVHTVTNAALGLRLAATDLRPAPPYDGFDGLKHHQQVQPKRHVLDVVEVVLQLFASLLQA